MHWISLISFFVIINLCQSQSGIYRNFEPANNNKDGAFQTVPSGNNADLSGTKTSATDSVHASTSNIPAGNSMKYEKDGQNTLKYMTNNGNNNYCYIMFPFIIATLMTIIHF